MHRREETRTIDFIGLVHQDVAFRACFECCGCAEGFDLAEWQSVRDRMIELRDALRLKRVCALPLAELSQFVPTSRAIR